MEFLLIAVLIGYFICKKLNKKYIVRWFIGVAIIFLITGIGDYFQYKGMLEDTSGFMPVYSIFFAPLIIFCFSLFIFDANKKN